MADTKSSANVPASGGSGGAAPSLGERVAGFFRAPAGGGVMKRKTSSTSRFIVGSITFILVAELLTYAIDYANIKFSLNLNQPILPGNTATWFSWFFLINVVIILGLWILLNKMGFFPRDMWARTTNSTARGGSSSSSGSSNRNSSKDNANQIPGIGGTRTRAERRHATAVAEAAAAAKSKKKGNGATAATTTTKPAKRGAVIEEVKVGSEHDAAYDRAKAAQRQRMRRARR